MAQKLPTTRPKLAEFYSRNPQYVKRHPKEAARNPKTMRAARALVAKRRAAKAADAKAADQAEFTAPLGTAGATGLADKLAGATYDPAIRASQFLQSKQLPDWHAGYTAQLKDIQQRQQAQQAAAVGQVQQFANTSSAVDAQQRAQLGQQMSQDAATRGAQVDPQIQATAQQAASSRRQATDSQGALLATQGAAQGSYLLDRERISRGDLIARQMEQGRVQRGLLTQRGAEKSRQLGTLREGERRNLLEQAIFRRELEEGQNKTALDAAKIEQAAADKAAGRTVTRRGQDITRRGQDISSADRAAAERGRNRRDGKTQGRAGDVTPTQARGITAQINKAWSYLDASKPQDRAKVLKTLKTGKGGISDPVYAQAAYDLITDGRIGSTTYHRLIAQYQGYKPPKQWLPRRPVIPKRVSGNVKVPVR